MAIKKCKCHHPGQDELHGKQMRVFNHVPRPSTQPDEYRCTVCRNSVTEGKSEEKKGS